MKTDKTILIRAKKEGMNTTISIKKSVLDLYSNTFFDVDYVDNKKYINKQIKDLINPESKNLSQLVSKFLLNMVQIEVKRLKDDCI